MLEVLSPAKFLSLFNCVKNTQKHTIQGGSNEALFQNQLRNVGLFMTLSLASLTYSRVFRHKYGLGGHRNLIGIGLAFGFLGISIYNSVILHKAVVWPKLDTHHKILLIAVNTTQLCMMLIIFSSFRDKNPPAIKAIKDELASIFSSYSHPMPDEPVQPSR